ncbi:MAG: hypothetical protein ACKVI6_06035 [Candidatus Poseidoniales archaeon]
MRPPETIEEELAIMAEALEAGIDPFKPLKEPSKLGKLALGWFLIILMVSWASQLLYHSL